MDVLIYTRTYVAISIYIHLGEYDHPMNNTYPPVNYSHSGWKQ